MTFEDLIKESQRLSKRANVRLKAQENKNTIEGAYLNAQEYLGNNRTRFYEGKKFSSQAEVEQQIIALNEYLNSKTSTISGYKKEQNKVTYVDTLKMSIEEKKQLYKKQVQTANRRLYTLEKNGYGNTHAIKKAQAFNHAQHVGNRFLSYSKIKNMSDKDLNNNLMHLLDFMNEKHSTIRGIKHSNKMRIDTFRLKGVNIPKGKEEDFQHFLESEQFRTMKKYGDSGQFVDAFARALDKGIDASEITLAFQQFLDDENPKTFDVIEEELGISEWIGME